MVVYSGALPAEPRSNNVVLRPERNIALASDAVQPGDQWRIQDFGSGGVKFQKFRPKPPMLFNFTVGAYTLHEIIKLNMKFKICESKTPTLGTLSMILLEVDSENIYYNIFNNTAIIYIGILQYLIVHRPRPSRHTTLTILHILYNLFVTQKQKTLLAKVSTTLLKSKF